MNNLKFFNEDCDPRDFKISFEPIPESSFNKMVKCFSSFPIQTQIGKRFTFVVKNYNLPVGFIRICSPVISLSNRNEYFNDTTLNPDQINHHMLNGGVIVPVQPFGYNYLGGKLLTLVCICNEMSDYIKSRVPDYCYFETTSLYGSIKGVSQYDGLKPYLRSNGLTQSKMLMHPTKDVYRELRKYIEPIYGTEEFGGRVVDTKKSSPKLREFNRLISIFEKNLKQMDSNKYEEFKSFKMNHMNTMTQKGYYYSTLGYSNVREHVLNNEPLIEQDKNKFDFSNLYNWWLNKSVNRYQSLKSKNEFRNELEHWGLETVNDMIR